MDKWEYKIIDCKFYKKINNSRADFLYNIVDNIPETMKWEWDKQCDESWEPSGGLTYIDVGGYIVATQVAKRKIVCKDCDEPIDECICHYSNYCVDCDEHLDNCTCEICDNCYEPIDDCTCEEK